MSQRRLTARILAGAIALGGTPEAILIGGLTLPALLSFEPSRIFVCCLFLPGWFAYFALILAAAGKKLIGDPATTWLPCIFVNGFWLLVLGAETDWTSENKAFVYWYVRGYVLAAVIGGIAGLAIEASQQSEGIQEENITPS